MNLSRAKNENGFMLLISLLIVGGAAMIFAIGLLAYGFDYTYMSGNYEVSRLAQNVANGCAEVALQKLRDNPSYAGNETITFPAGESCTIKPILGTGTTNRVIQAQGYSVGQLATKRTEVRVATVASHMELTSWQEVTDFSAN